MKIYYSKFFQDYIFVIGGQPYLILEGVNFFSESSVFVPVDRNHLKNSRMHKREEEFYSSHRLAWLYVHGVWPKNFIDHINGDKSDNRICNLREATRRENAQNLKIHRAGKLAGCSYNKKINKWNARMTINKKYINLGFYETEVEAHLAYKNACSSLSETTTRLQKLRDGK